MFRRVRANESIGADRLAKKEPRSEGSNKSVERTPQLNFEYTGVQYPGTHGQLVRQITLLLLLPELQQCAGPTQSFPDVNRQALFTCSLTKLVVQSPSTVALLYTAFSDSLISPSASWSLNLKHSPIKRRCSATADPISALAAKPDALTLACAAPPSSQIISRKEEKSINGGVS